MNSGVTGPFFKDRAFLRRHLETITGNRERRRLDAAGLKTSAVLLPLCWRDAAPQLVLTRRSMAVEYHKGEIAFPGGRTEPDDGDPTATALREAWEEIGLDPADVEVLGLLDDQATIFCFHITPVVGIIPYPYEFSLNAESDSLIFLPLEKILSETEWMLQTAEIDGRAFPVCYLECEQGVVWGVTGRILKHFADLIAGKELPFAPVSRSALAWVRNVTAAQRRPAIDEKGLPDR